MSAELFRCPRSGQKLRQKDQSLVSLDGLYSYALVEGVPDFYVEEGVSRIPPDDANRKWLDAHAVSGRDLYYERCREWAGMAFCMDRISSLSHAQCRILEVGTGTGHFSRWLGEDCAAGTQIFAFDFSWPCIATAQARIDAHQSVHLFRANARGPMPFEPKGFDLILQRLASFAAKGATPRAKAQRILDLLKPGGYYIFVGWEEEYASTCDHFI